MLASSSVLFSYYHVCHTDNDSDIPSMSNTRSVCIFHACTLTFCKKILKPIVIYVCMNSLATSRQLNNIIPIVTIHLPDKNEYFIYIYI